MRDIGVPAGIITHHCSNEAHTHKFQGVEGSRKCMCRPSHWCTPGRTKPYLKYPQPKYPSLWIIFTTQHSRERRQNPYFYITSPIKHYLSWKEEEKKLIVEKYKWVGRADLEKRWTRCCLYSRDYECTQRKCGLMKRQGVSGKKALQILTVSGGGKRCCWAPQHREDRHKKLSSLKSRNREEADGFVERHWYLTQHPIRICPLTKVTRSAHRCPSFRTIFIEAHSALQ